MRRLYLMMRLAPLALAGRVSAQSTAEASDFMAYVTGTTVVRARPFSTADTVRSLHGRIAVRVSRCEANWCRISTKGTAGFVRRTELTELREPLVGVEREDDSPSGGERTPTPARTPRKRPPPGASALCRDGTFSFSRTRSGTCSHHGGVQEWL